MCAKTCRRFTSYLSQACILLAFIVRIIVKKKVLFLYSASLLQNEHRGNLGQLNDKSPVADILSDGLLTPSIHAPRTMIPHKAVTYRLHLMNEPFLSASGKEVMYRQAMPDDTLSRACRYIIASRMINYRKRLKF